MPKIIIDYSKCCIYKIERIENDKMLYVGHTTEFNKRKGHHKNNCKNTQGKLYNLKLYQMIRENGNWEMFRMIEIEKFSCNDKREAAKKENEVMKELKANMNTYKSYLTNDEIKEKKKDWRLNNKEKKKKHDKKYYENNKNEINEKSKEYYIDNKNEINEKMKEYYINNKKHIIEQSDKYYKNNKEQILEKHKEKTKCACGCEILKMNLKRHQNSKKHIDLMNEKNQ